VSDGDDRSKKILVLGGTGMVGSAIARELKSQGYERVMTPTRKELDLLNQESVRGFFQRELPEWVFLAAAKVGGIVANNTLRADFIHENLALQQNVFSAAFSVRTSKLQFFGSSCIYPRACPQPMKEEYLLTGPLEPTNEPYAIAKIAGLKTVEAFRQQYGLDWFSVMPTNLYGPGDNYHPEHSHVVPALIRRTHEAKSAGRASLSVWGTGRPRREFLYVEDLAAASVMLMKQKGLQEVLGGSFINVGLGQDITIAELAREIAQTVGFSGEINFDTSKPDGTSQKLLDVSKIRALGWRPSTSLQEGLKRAYAEFQKKSSGMRQ
jgi:GDP-L-fucose synthase